jgi:hypothetical protein
MGRLRPRTRLVKSRKLRRCPKCGCAINNQRKRCKKCHAVTPLP